MTNVQEIIRNKQEEKNPILALNRLAKELREEMKETLAQKIEELEISMETRVTTEVATRMTQISEGVITLEKAILKMKGDEGDEGAPGPQGEPGLPGPEGKPGESITGPAGPQGPEGKPGQPGPQGKEGNAGAPGRPGENGKNGSPDTPQEVVAKINTLTEEVEQKTIKGLLKEFKALWEAVRTKPQGKGEGTGGGGMGNWVHEQFSISSATTSVTLRTPVAASGNALMVRYQGQMLALGVQYTGPGRSRTIPLLFTPEDSTVLHVTYVRT